MTDEEEAGTWLDSTYDLTRDNLQSPREQSRGGISPRDEDID